MAFKQTDITLHIKEYLSISSKELAAKIGVTEVTASNIVNNKTTPSVATLYKIAAALGVSVSQLLNEDVAPHEAASDFAAFIRYKGVHYTADTIDEFNKIVEKIKTITK